MTVIEAGPGSTGTDLAVLEEIQQRVLWLATRIVVAANHDRDTGDGVKDRDRAVEHTQRALDLDGEVDVPGCVDDVDPVALPLCRGRRRSDRDAALLLLLHPVHHRRALVHLADLVGAPGVVQDALGRRRLTGVDVRHDPDVPGVMEGELAWHGSGGSDRGRAGDVQRTAGDCFKQNLKKTDKKNGPLGPTRAIGLIWTGSRRYLLEVSILVFSSGDMLARLRHPRSDDRL